MKNTNYIMVWQGKIGNMVSGIIFCPKIAFFSKNEQDDPRAQNNLFKSPEIQLLGIELGVKQEFHNGLARKKSETWSPGFIFSQNRIFTKIDKDDPFVSSKSTRSKFKN